MVRRRNSRTPNTRRRRTNRPQIRQMARALSFEPHRAALTSDPPAITRTYIFNTVIVCPVVITATTGFDPRGVTLDSPIFGCAKQTTTTPASYETCSATYAELYAAWKNWTRHAPLTTDTVEVCVAKVCFWGPSPQTLSGVEIALTLNNAAPFSALAVRDAGTTNARPKCGITAPFKNWVTAASPTKIISVDPDSCAILTSLDSKLAEGSILGTVHITMCVRHTCAA